MNTDSCILDLLEKAILEVKDEILEREKILYENYNILNLLDEINGDN